ncbi:MAG: hypothetical protein QXT53_04660 [Ignisphaera sp.]
MTEYRFIIGKQEKHEIFIRYSEWTGKLIVDVDGRRVVETYAIGFKKELEMDVGDNEKHKIKIVLKGIMFPKIEVYVDGEKIYTA